MNVINVEIEVDDLSKILADYSDKVILYNATLSYIIQGEISALDNKYNEIFRYYVVKNQFTLDRSISAYQYRLYFFLHNGDRFQKAYLPMTRDNAEEVIIDFFNGGINDIVIENTGNIMTCKFIK